MKTRWSRRVRDFFDLRGAGTQLLVGILVVLILGGGALWLNKTRSAVKDILSFEIDVWIVLLGGAVVVFLYLVLRSAASHVGESTPRPKPKGTEDRAPRETSTTAEAPFGRVGAPAAPPQTKAERKPVYKWVGGDWREGDGTLEIKNSHLESFYERALNGLKERGVSGRLYSLFISVYPFQTAGGQARVFMTFYSDDSEKEYEHLFDEFDQMRADPPYDRGRASQCWDEPPWRRQPHWPAMVRKSSLIVGRLIQDSNTHLYIYPTGPTTESWTISWFDEGARRDYVFAGSSAEDLRQLR